MGRTSPRTVVLSPWITMKRLLPMLEALTLLILAGVLLAGFQEWLDIHVWDEMRYLADGRDLLDFRLSTLFGCRSPITSTIYGVIDLVPFGDHLPCDVMFVLVFVGAMLALWWALRPATGPVAAVLLAAWWATLTPVLHYGLERLEPSVYLLHGMLCFLAFGSLLRRRTGWAGFFMTLAALNRSEATPWLVATGVMLWLASRGPGRIGWRPAGRAYVAIGLGLLLLQAANGHTRAISWLAFRQHYARNVASGRTVPLQDAKGKDAFAYPDESVRRDFGEARSVLGAAKANPSAFWGHLCRNVAHLPGGLAPLAVGGFPFCSPVRHLYLALFGALTVGVLVLAGASRRWRSRLKPEGLSGQAVCGILGALALLAAPLAIQPRTNLLLPLALPVYLVAGMAVAAAWRNLATRVPWPRAMAIVPMILSLALLPLLPRPFAGQPPVKPPFRAAASLCRKHLPDGPVRLLGANAFGMGTLAARRELTSLSLYGMTSPEISGCRTIAQVLARFRATHLLVTPALIGLCNRYPDLELLLRQPRGAIGREWQGSAGIRLIELDQDALTSLLSTSTVNTR